MFRRLDGDDPPRVAFRFDGRDIEARAGESVAAALLAAGIPRFRASAVSGAPRGPYCLMGACFDCLVRIDGIAHRQACMVEVRNGMVVESQTGKPEIMR